MAFLGAGIGLGALTIAVILSSFCFRCGGKIGLFMRACTMQLKVV